MRENTLYDTRQRFLGVDEISASSSPSPRILMTAGRLTNLRCDKQGLASIILRDLQRAIEARYPDRDVIPTQIRAEFGIRILIKTLK